ncbi:hypothetical protein GCM10010191_65770 [Actinomadura vinacea]|uniref:Uncharacterized protein n=1 Tax=Actinomadura vinacea TaxID=115336 RepID=A0ABN3JXJ6_9ACTN
MKLDVAGLGALGEPQSLAGHVRDQSLRQADRLDRASLNTSPWIVFTLTFPGSSRITRGQIDAGHLRRVEQCRS